MIEGYIAIFTLPGPGVGDGKPGVVVGGVGEGLAIGLVVGDTGVVTPGLGVVGSTGVVGPGPGIVVGGVDGEVVGGVGVGPAGAPGQLYWYCLKA